MRYEAQNWAARHREAPAGERFQTLLKRQNGLRARQTGSISARACYRAADAQSENQNFACELHGGSDAGVTRSIFQIEQNEKKTTLNDVKNISKTLSDKVTQDVIKKGEVRFVRQGADSLPISLGAASPFDLMLQNLEIFGIGGRYAWRVPPRRSLRQTSSRKVLGAPL